MSKQFIVTLAALSAMSSFSTGAFALHQYNLNENRSIPVRAGTALNPPGHNMTFMHRIKDSMHKMRGMSDEDRFERQKHREYRDGIHGGIAWEAALAAQKHSRQDRGASAAQRTADRASHFRIAFSPHRNQEVPNGENRFSLDPLPTHGVPNRNNGFSLNPLPSYEEATRPPAYDQIKFPTSTPSKSQLT